MVYRIAIFFYVFIFHAIESIANRDSLWAIWQDETALPTERLAVLEVLYDLYEMEPPDSCLPIVEAQIQYATEQQELFWLAKGLGNRAELYSLDGAFDSALVYYNQAVELFKETKKREEIGYFYLEMGHNEYSLSGSEKAFEWWEKARQSGIRHEQYDLISNSLNALGATYREHGDLVKALDLLLQQSHVFETKVFDKSKAIDPYADIATIYYKLNELDSALLYIDKALDYNNIHNPDKPGYNAISYSYKGQFLEEKGQIAAAKQAYEKMLDLSYDPLYEEDFIYPLSIFSEFLLNQKSDQANIYIDSLIYLAQKYDYRSDITVSYELKGRFLLAKGENMEALHFCQSARELLDEDAPNDILTSVCDCLYESHKALHNYEQALAFYEQSQQIKQAALNEESIRKLTQLEMKAIAERDKATAQLTYESNLQRQRFIQYGLVGGLGLLSLLAFLIYRNYKNEARANKLIEAQRQKLEQLNETKDRLFAIIGHDLRRPALAFRGIGKKINYLINKKDYNTLNQLSETLEKSAFSLNNLLDNLLNWALQQRNILPYHPQPINVEVATIEICELFEEMAREKNIDLSLNLEESASVFTDPNALNTVFRNLLDNAIKFTPEGGKIEIHSAVEEEQLLLQFKDTGVGMSKSELDTLFELKKNKSKRGTQGEAGSGLGLLLVKDLLQLNKGSIKVKSQLNIGTTFDVFLPLAT